MSSLFLGGATERVGRAVLRRGAAPHVMHRDQTGAPGRRSVNSALDTPLFSPDMPLGEPTHLRSNYAVTESCVPLFTLSVATGLVGSCNTVAC